jgi:two-component system response regulator (stage 0 sporulation protein F)
MGSQLIVIADADRGSARFLAKFLSLRGFRTLCTPWGEDALRLALDGRLGLAIVDVALLDMSGHALAAALKEIDPDVPVLMTTADYSPELERHARRLGVLYYAQKPFDCRRIEAVVAKAVDGSKTSG